MTQRLSQHGLITLAGLATSILTAAAVALVDPVIGINVFSFSLFVVIPVGAGLCGFAAASGYYFAAKFLHQPPGKFLLIQMVVIAAFTQLLIYWLEYQSLVVEGRHVADYVSFGQYMDTTLTSTHMKVGKALIDTGEVGSFGYWLAAFDFVGFLVGGVFVYFWLVAEPKCEPCGRYLRVATKKKDSFSSFDEFAPYYDGVYVNPVDTPEFAQHVGTEYSAGKAEQGTINLTTSVLECPKCFAQSIRETVQIHNGKEWKDAAELTRLVAMPTGVDVRSAFS